MAILILVGPTPDIKRFKAKVNRPYDLAVEANDRDTAVSALVELLGRRAPGEPLVRCDWAFYSNWYEAFESSDADDPYWLTYIRFVREAHDDSRTLERWWDNTEYAVQGPEKPIDMLFWECVLENRRVQDHTRTASETPEVPVLTNIVR